MATKTQGKSDGLSLIQLVWIGTGQVVGAGIITITGAAIMVTGRSVWVAYAVAVLMGLFRILPSIFFTSAMVTPGGNYGILTRTFGERIGGLVTINSLVQWTVRGTAVIALGMYIHSVFPHIDQKLAAALIWIALIVANCMGVDMMAKLQSFGTPLLLLSLMLFAILGMIHARPDSFDFASPEFITAGAAGFGSAVVMLNYSTVGQAMMSSLSTRCKRPTRDLPNAMLISTAIILVLYVSVSFAAANVLPMAEIAGKPLTPTAKLLMPAALFAAFIIGGPIMALLTTMNSGVPSNAMPVVAGAKAGWVPAFFAKENRYHSPWISYVIIGVIGLIPMLAGISVADITNFCVALGSINTFMMITSAFYLPTKFASEWNASHLHLPKAVYYPIMVVSGLVQTYVTVISLKSLSLPLALINICVLTCAVTYGIVRFRTGAISRVETV